jgi:hypothetical protein
VKLVPFPRPFELDFFRNLFSRAANRHPGRRLQPRRFAALRPAPHPLSFRHASEANEEEPASAPAEAKPGVPAVVQLLVMLAACVIALRGNFKPDDEKSLASLLVAYITVFVRICAVCMIVWESVRPRVARDDAQFRVWFVASCLVAVLRLLDGRVSFRDEV